MNERKDFFSYYNMAKNQKFAMEKETFRVYEDLLLEAWEYFDKFDMMKGLGSVMAKVFEDLYIGGHKEKDDIALENGIGLRTLHDYRIQYDRFAVETLKRRKIEISIGRFSADRIT